LTTVRTAAEQLKEGSKERKELDAVLAKFGAEGEKNKVKIAFGAALLLVLPEEIPNYKGSVKVLRDAEFVSFEKARYNYLPEAPIYSAVFVGQLEYAKRGKGVGYNKNHRVRLVLQAVPNGTTDRDAK
jgi:hypothetical protein